MFEDEEKLSPLFLTSHLPCSHATNLCVCVCVAVQRNSHVRLDGSFFVDCGNKAKANKRHERF